ncbi:hypothetical protein KORDIASMS9_02345 [Kordia sp. SMS9]|uniref:DUF2851 family protein n=1 Tax=Kordia sp. SMS9 TaxID=2282170 RepID=UPI000E0CD2CB|nr:DUF2851 family protein [Kordia sp. SMS9]AXG70116.1 hypothetical protein KORDIASMS9_02345 [Kordia sp. SMS9]
MSIREDFLYYVWKFGKLHLQPLETTQKEPIEIINLGTHNQHAGPDFFNARLRIGRQLWAGNVEMHVNAADWFVHNHENDANYDNVILHVVWNHDIDIHRKDNSVIPTLVLKNYSDAALLQRYQHLLNTPKQWISCENKFPVLHHFELENWLERVYLERLEAKAVDIEKLVKETKYDWEAVLFRLLAKGFGLKLNSDAFYEAACLVDFSLIRKLGASQFSLEAFLFGIFGLLSQEVTQENYDSLLRQEYVYLCRKYEHTKKANIPLQFFRTRPANFPTIRASQLATLYHQRSHLFSKLIATTSLNVLYKLLQVETSTFWQTHYTFEKQSPKRIKKVSKTFIDVLLINSILPLKYCYEKYLGKPDVESLLSLLRAISPEKNAIIQKFNTKKIDIENALHTQALLQLKKSYCDQQKCLECAIGNRIVK